MEVTFPSRAEVHQIVEMLVNFGLREILDNFFSSRADWIWEMVERGICCAKGLSKLCYFLDDNWVLKFPFGDYDDLCRREAENWARAKKDGVARFFAPCYYYGEVLGIPVYLQRRVECDRDSVEALIWAYAERENPQEPGEDNYSYSERVGELVNAEFSDYENCVALLGSFAAERIEGFLAANDINDLHPGNFGVLRRDDHSFGSWVIFDYSGF